MGDIKPIEYSQVPFQLMDKLSDQMLEQKLLKQKRIQEEFDQKMKLMDLTEPEVLNKNLESEVADAAVASLRDRVVGYMKKNQTSSVLDFKNVISKELAQVYDWNSKVKSIKDKLENTFKNIPNNSSINKSAWMNAALTRALYADVIDANGNKKRVLRDASLLDPSYDYASDVWNKNGDAFVVTKEVDASTQKLMKDSPTTKEDVTVSVGATRSSKGFTKELSIEVPTYGVWNPTSQRLEVKTDKDGLVDQKVYDMFIGQKGSEVDWRFNSMAKNKLSSGSQIPVVKAEDVFDANGKIINQPLFDQVKANISASTGIQRIGPATDRMLNEETTNAIKNGGKAVSISFDDVYNKNGSVKDESKLDYVKKILLKEYIEEFSPTIKKNRDVVQQAKQDIKVYTGSAAPPTPTIDILGEIKQYRIDNPEKPYIQMNILSNAAQDAILESVRNKSKKANFDNTNTKIVSSEGKDWVVAAEDIYSLDDTEKIIYKKGSYISPVDYKQNMSANKPLGKDAVTKSVNNDKKTGASGL